MRNLITYYTYFCLNFLLVVICGHFAIENFIEQDISMTCLWTFCFSIDVNSIIDRHENFVRFYPHFEHKWLYFI